MSPKKRYEGYMNLYLICCIILHHIICQHKKVYILRVYNQTNICNIYICHNMLLKTCSSISWYITSLLLLLRPHYPLSPHILWTLWISETGKTTEWTLIHLTPQLMLMVSTLRSLPYAGTLLASFYSNGSRMYAAQNVFSDNCALRMRLAELLSSFRLAFIKDQI